MRQRIRNEIASLLIGCAVAISLPSWSGATEVDECDGPDRKTTFVIAAPALPAFKAAVRNYAKTMGLRYFEDAAGAGLEAQTIAPERWKWGILIFTSPGNPDASAAFNSGTACPKALPSADERRWKQFIAHIEKQGYRATKREPRFSRSQ